MTDTSLRTNELTDWARSRRLSDADAHMLRAVFEVRDALAARVEELTEALETARCALESPTFPRLRGSATVAAVRAALQSTGEGPVKCDACGSTDGPCVTAPDYGDCAAPTEAPVNLTPAELSASWERLRERIPDLPHVTFIRCDSCDAVKPSDLIDHDPASGINLCKDGKHRAALTGKEGE